MATLMTTPSSCAVLLSLHEATGEQRWLDDAQSLTDTMIKQFWDDKNGGFYFTLADQAHLVVRTKNPYDSRSPQECRSSQQSTHPHAVGWEERLSRQSGKNLQSFAGMMAQSPEPLCTCVLP